MNQETQSPGGNFKAASVSYKTGKTSAEFSLDIAGAYPQEAQVNSWKRTVTLNRGKGVQVKDVIDLKKAGSVTQHLMT